ncbi:MAG: OadG family protein [Chloroflexi bacterium]|nr:OadG family protein [Chloroflexota bacterium]
MWENISIGLQLTLFGTGLVFVVLAFLWGLMALLLKVDVVEETEEEVPARVTQVETPGAVEKALIALAILRHRGEEEGTEVSLPAVEGHVQGLWTVVGRVRQLQSWHPRRGEE